MALFTDCTYCSLYQAHCGAAAATVIATTSSTATLASVLPQNFGTFDVVSIAVLVHVQARSHIYTHSSSDAATAVYVVIAVAALENRVRTYIRL